MDNPLISRTQLTTGFTLGAGQSLQPGRSPTWSTCAQSPLLPPGSIHVWRVHLPSVDPSLEELLSDDERARAERIVDEHSRRLRMRSRGVLRALLGRYLQLDPSTLRFNLGPHGKPALLGGGPAFNLSHSGTLAVYALSASAEVGVDVQLDLRQIDEAAIARRFLTAADARALAQLPPPERRTEFLRAWVRHEAALKCRGSGFAAGREAGTGRTGKAVAAGRAAGAGLAGGAAAAAGAGSAEGKGSTVDAAGVLSALWLADLDAGAGAAAAVACEEHPHELHCWDW